MKPTRDIHLHIERLVLDGLTINAGQSTLFADALQAKLLRLLTDWGMEADATAVLASVAASPVDLPPKALPTTTAVKVAGAVHQALTQTLSARGGFQRRPGVTPPQATSADN